MKARLSIFILLVTILIAVGHVHGQPLCPLDTLNPRKIESLAAFKRIPLLDNGRIKPLETFAESFLLQLSGRRSYEKENALEWFARFLFAPRTTFDDKIFLINNPEILEAIRVEPEKKRRYSYRQLEAGYAKIQQLAEVVDEIEGKDRSVVEQEILRAYNNIQWYIRLSGAFSFGFPHPDFTIDKEEVFRLLDLPTSQNQFSFFDMYERIPRLVTEAQSLSTKAPDQWNATEVILGRLLSAMFFWTEHYANCPLGLIPTKAHEDEHWLSPMDTIRLNAKDSDYDAEIKYIRNMTIHYWNGEQLEFDLAARAFIDSVNSRLSIKEKRAADKIPLELLYNQLKLFLWAKLFYGLGALVILIFLLSERKWFYRLAVGLTVAGFISHILAIILRITILSRPPVSNLYETFLFVGLIAVLLGSIIERVNKNGLGLFIANICGLALLFISGKFGSDGDTMQMLVAVLNSNFWLTTHVLAITTGYAGCCVAGVLGHIYIVQALFLKPEDQRKLDNTLKNMLGILGFGLTMTFLGTALGGIWADQSWGRFWGWDPKENGALLIVLWCAIIFHARIGRLINPLGVAVGCVLGMMVVMWAWFGVNLLSVGLHSYGFTSGIAGGLVSYVLAELLFLAITTALLGKKGIQI